jgi:hypothetical protein
MVDQYILHVASALGYNALHVTHNADCNCAFVKSSHSELLVCSIGLFVVRCMIARRFSVERKQKRHKSQLQPQ